MPKIIFRGIPKGTPEQLQEKAQKLSEAAYQNHSSNIGSFDYNNPITTNDKPLTEVEKAFLKYVAGMPVNNPQIAGYWTHEYKITYKYLMSKFFNDNYLTVGFAPEKLTVEVLKDILDFAGMPKTGKKSSLVDRVKTIPENQ